MLKTKSVETAIDRQEDGLRILVTRFRGRGMPTSRYDVWMASLGPSERLFRAWQAGRISWAAFARDYRRELMMDGPIDARSKTIKNHGQKFTLRLIKKLARRGNVTLMCHCAEDQPQVPSALAPRIDSQQSDIRAMVSHCGGAAKTVGRAKS